MDKIAQFLPDKYEAIIAFVFIILMTICFNWIALRAFNRFMRRNVDSDGLTNFKFIGNALTTIIYVVGIIIAIREIPMLRTFAGSLLAGAGIVAAIVGFASQQAFSNIVSGIFIVMSKPFRVNDRLKIKDIYAGTVEDITLRHTVIRDFENRRIIVPNAVIASEILVNSDYNDDHVCKFVEVNISFKADIDKAKWIIADSIGNHPLYIDRRTEADKEAGKPLVAVKIVRMTDWALVLRGDAWAQNPTKSFELYCDLLETIKKRFDTEGIEIPYPHYVIDKNMN